MLDSSSWACGEEENADSALLEAADAALARSEALLVSLEPTDSACPQS